MGLGKLELTSSEESDQAEVDYEAMLNRNLVAHGTWQASRWRRVLWGRERRKRERSPGRTVVWPRPRRSDVLRNRSGVGLVSLFSQVQTIRQACLSLAASRSVSCVYVLGGEGGRGGFTLVSVEG